MGEFYSSTPSLASSDVVEPINYEEYVEDHADVIARDPLKCVVSIPSDDVDVRLIQRRSRTLKPILPEYNDFNDQEDPYINDCIRTYTANWVVVVKK